MGKKVKKVKGFQMNKITGHTSYAFRQNNVDVESIGFTHNEADKVDKIRLKHNINPNDNSPCFAKTMVEKQKYNTYREKSDYKDYRIHGEDMPVFSGLIEKHENARRKNKKRR